MQLFRSSLFVTLRSLSNSHSFPCRNVVNIFLLIYQLGTCCVYVVFVSTNIKSILDLYLEEVTDVRLVMLVILLPLILINWVRNLKYLAPFSTIANLITMVSFGIILYYIFREPISLDGLEAVGEVRNWPLFFGTVLFALEAIGVILPLENEMKTPKVRNKIIRQLLFILKQINLNYRDSEETLES